ncbi:MAG: tetratricopeptide repeat protein [Candidatus Margulisiibacteriota bacterium]
MTSKVVVGIWMVMTLFAGSLQAESLTAAWHNNLGVRALKKGDPKAAQIHLEKAIKTSDAGEAWANMGSSYYAQKDWQKSEEAYLKAIQKLPPSKQAKIYYNLGNVYHQKQDLEKAIAAYRESLKRNPNDEDAKYNLEAVLVEKRRSPKSPPPPDPTPPKPNENRAKLTLNTLRDHERESRNRFNQIPKPSKQGDQDW